MAIAQTGWSADGNWFWDGAAWKESISGDGKWRFDGASWVPFAGARTPMPAAAPAMPVTAPMDAAVNAAAAPMPDWVAPSEIDRLANEKREREAIAVQPAAPLAPEQDWRRVGEFMEYSRNRTYRPSQVGLRSFLIYIALLWLCGPLAIFYVWRTGWSVSRKLIATFVCFLSLLALLAYVQNHRTTS